MWARILEIIARLFGKAHADQAAADKAESEAIHTEVTAKNHPPPPPEGSGGA